MSEGLPAPPTHPCPACGLPVTAGYPRCPKCHAAQPAPESPTPPVARTTRRTAVAAGGSTATAPDRRGALRVAALVATLGAAVAGVAWLATRGGYTRAGAVMDAGVPDAADEDEPTEAPEDDEPAPPRAPAADPGPDLAGAMRALDEALRTERLWATVRRERTMVVIESSLCEEPAMQPTVDTHLDALRAAGASGVQCRALHGAVVFERGL